MKYKVKLLSRQEFKVLGLYISQNNYLANQTFLFKIQKLFLKKSQTITLLLPNVYQRNFYVSQLSGDSGSKKYLGYNYSEAQFLLGN